MTLLTAEQAAKRLGRTERTIRRWIAESKLQATHPTHGHTSKFLIDESEVERLAQELEQEQPVTEQAEQPVTEQAILTPYQLNRILERLADLEIKIAALTQLYYAEHRTIATTEPTEPIAAETHLPTRTATKRATAPIGASIDVPAGSILASDFAKRYGVNARTFRDHIVAGMRKTGRRVEAIEREKPHRPGEREYWLTPEQQEQAIAFWQAHNVRFTMPPAKDQATAEAVQEAHSADFSASDL